MKVQHMIRASALVAGIIASSARAQNAVRARGRVPVMVAVVDRTPFGADIALVRRPDAPTKNLIVLATNAATPDRLSAAALALTATMERDGDVPTRSELLSIPNDASGPPRERGAAAQVLTRIQRAQEIDVAGLGKARTTVIYLPDASERQRLQSIGRLRMARTQ